jgi:hypothetical protein
MNADQNNRENVNYFDIRQPENIHHGDTETRRTARIAKIAEIENRNVKR